MRRPGLEPPRAAARMPRACMLHDPPQRTRFDPVDGQGIQAVALPATLVVVAGASTRVHCELLNRHMDGVAQRVEFMHLP